MPKKSNKLLIFTKSPVLGEVKTRLQPTYSTEQSLKIHKLLVKKVLELTKTLVGVDIELCCTPDRTTKYFLECENNYPIQLSNQYGADLGERMALSLSVALQTYDKVVIIGTDCPELDEKYITNAFSELSDFDAVIGPAVDGGYVLLGLRKFSLDIFTGIKWGGDTVLIQTENAFDELSWTYKELGIMHDIDLPEDLQRHPDLLNEIS